MEGGRGLIWGSHGVHDPCGELSPDPLHPSLQVIELHQL
jgi:hypothetical protein